MDIMNPNCIHAKKGNLNEIVKQAHMKGVSLIPIVNDSNKVIDAHEVPIKLKEKKLNTVVIMAGGKGTRLLPITQNIPKPMIKVGGKPILARIIEKLIQEGFENIIISLGIVALNIVIWHFAGKVPYISYIWSLNPRDNISSHSSNINTFNLSNFKTLRFIKSNVRPGVPTIIWLPWEMASIL